MKKSIFGLITLAIAALLYGANYNPSKTVSIETNKCHDYQKLMRAYNNLLHRVWIDRPGYVEEVLSETREFVVLDSLLNSDWDDIFIFYDVKDSIDYHHNLKKEL